MRNTSTVKSPREHKRSQAGKAETLARKRARATKRAIQSSGKVR